MFSSGAAVAEKEIFQWHNWHSGCVILAASVFKLAVWEFMLIWTSFKAYGIILDHFSPSSKVQRVTVFLAKSYWPGFSKSVIQDRWTCENSSHRKTPLLKCFTRHFCVLIGKRKQEDLSTSKTQLFHDIKIALGSLIVRIFLKKENNFWWLWVTISQNLISFVTLFFNWFLGEETRTTELSLYTLDYQRFFFN